MQSAQCKAWIKLLRDHKTDLGVSDKGRVHRQASAEHGRSILWLELVRDRKDESFVGSNGGRVAWENRGGCESRLVKERDRKKGTRLRGSGLRLGTEHCRCRSL